MESSYDASNSGRADPAKGIESIHPRSPGTVKVGKRGERVERLMMHRPYVGLHKGLRSRESIIGHRKKVATVYRWWRHADVQTS